MGHACRCKPQLRLLADDCMPAVQAAHAPAGHPARACLQTSACRLPPAVPSRTCAPNGSPSAVQTTLCRALLLEMYTRDGTPGVCMIAADLYEGIR